MKWLLVACSLTAFPALAVYQPTDNEMALLEKLKKGTEQNLKYALPLQSKAEICRAYLDLFRREHPDFNYYTMSSYMTYWGNVQGNTEQSMTIAHNILPQLYYYEHKLYEKFGKYKLSPQDVNVIFEKAMEDNYLNLNQYIAINQQFKENLRKKDLTAACMTPPGEDPSRVRDRASAATHVDKLFYQGYLPIEKSSSYNNQLNEMYAVLRKIRESYF